MRLSKDKMDIIKTTVEQSNQIMGELDVKLRKSAILQLSLK